MANCAAIAILVAGFTANFAEAQTSNTQPPSFDAVAKSLGSYFASLRDYQSGDLITQRRVADALKYVAKTTGWEVPQRDAIVKLALAEDSFLAIQLSTPRGRPFMRSLAKYPGTYSRLDRLSTISGGQQFIKDMITRKDGYIMIEYLATTQGGHELGALMAGVQHGVDLNKPTGRIYTESDLQALLKSAYDKSSP